MTLSSHCRYIIFCDWIRGRSFASGVAAAVSYIMGFFATKTFLSLEAGLSLGGVFLLYGVLALSGVVFLYFNMKETEGRSLEQIEQDYKTNKWRFLTHDINNSVIL